MVHWDKNSGLQAFKLVESWCKVQDHSPQLMTRPGPGRARARVSATFAFASHLPPAADAGSQKKKLTSCHKHKDEAPRHPPQHGPHNTTTERARGARVQEHRARACGEVAT